MHDVLLIRPFRKTLQSNLKDVFLSSIDINKAVDLLNADTMPKDSELQTKESAKQINLDKYIPKANAQREKNKLLCIMYALSQMGKITDIDDPGTVAKIAREMQELGLVAGNPKGTIKTRLKDLKDIDVSKILAEVIEEKLAEMIVAKDKAIEITKKNPN